METGILAEWYVSEGSSFSAGEPLAKVETDKGETTDSIFASYAHINAFSNDRSGY